MQVDIINCPDFVVHSTGEVRYKIIGRDFWDGPTSGILKCGVCGAEYGFDLIDWEEKDDGNDLRVFALTPRPKGTMDQIVSILSKWKSPNWPVWTPLFSSKKIPSSASKRVAQILKFSGQPTLVMAWLGHYADKILAVRNISDSDIPDVEKALKIPRKASNPRDWFQFLGLDRMGSYK